MWAPHHPDYPDQHTELRYLGFWRSMDRRRTRDPFPDPLEFVDPEWSTFERAMTAEYLRTGGRVLYTWLGSSTCRVCGLRPNGTTCLTDGVYCWPEGLAHAVEEHGVRPPAEFVDHAIRRLRETRR